VPSSPAAGFPNAPSNRERGILIVTGAGVSLGLASFAAWRTTGDALWLNLYFQWPAPVLMVGLAAVEAWLSLSVRRAFLPVEPLYWAWTLIGASAACDLLGNVCSQWLSSGSPLNPLLHSAWWSQDQAQELRQFGLVMGGLLRYFLLAAGLLAVLRIYRKAGFLGRLAATDWVLLGIVVTYVAKETGEVVLALYHGKSPGISEILGWPVDPLLLVLLFETRLLARSVQRMGKGAIGQCWKAFSIGVLLVWLGDLGLWATVWRHLPWEWAALGWYVWLPAGGAFAVAPAYQLEAIEHAMNEPGGRSEG